MESRGCLFTLLPVRRVLITGLQNYIFSGPFKYCVFFILNYSAAKAANSPLRFSHNGVVVHLQYCVCLGLVSEQQQVRLYCVIVGPMYELLRGACSLKSLLSFQQTEYSPPASTQGIVKHPQNLKQKKRPACKERTCGVKLWWGQEVQKLKLEGKTRAVMLLDIFARKQPICFGFVTAV